MRTTQIGAGSRRPLTLAALLAGVLLAASGCGNVPTSSIPNPAEPSSAGVGSDTRGCSERAPQREYGSPDAIERRLATAQRQYGSPDAIEHRTAPTC